METRCTLSKVALKHKLNHVYNFPPTNQMMKVNGTPFIPVGNSKQCTEPVQQKGPECVDKLKVSGVPVLPGEGADPY